MTTATRPLSPPLGGDRSNWHDWIDVPHECDCSGAFFRGLLTGVVLMGVVAVVVFAPWIW